MSRDLTAEMTTATAAKNVAPFALVEMAFDSDYLRLWSGIGTLNWNSVDWLGAGDLGKISAIKETETMRAEGLILELSAIPSENIALALTEPYQGRIVKVWLGALDGQTIINAPKQIFAGRMDVMEIEESGDLSTISVSVESRIIDLLKSRERRYTHEDQQIDYPGDLGLEFVASLQNKEIEWEPS
ncbi:MAG: hypothetical protein L3J57_01625 [Desulfuromusa sp.]|nr:hypothetical protein [Desulfuromusa sp.]